ncbi:MAG TPA: isoprenoid biosynthesis glyoxalase ElbB [Desulfuromonadales bacterium]|jgi:enhancing lycopene biosynthesis protein 2|nr:isoprenoid biosynthesis glyoxalase ElbB [Desulfuromonadales bacterium]
MKKIGVLLSGCGVFDGSEIHEATFALLAIDRAGCQAVCMAPNAEFAVTNHLTKEAGGETRNALVEAARIARGNILDLKDVQVGDLDAVVLPGGFGAAKNLCDFAVKGSAATVHPEVTRLLREISAAGKPIGAICIAPVVIAAVLGKQLTATVTIGNDSGTAAEIEKTGARHVECPVHEIVVDRKNKIVSTPAYMLATRISEVADGIDKCVKEVVNLI